jgi:hypothetical protein
MAETQLYTHNDIQRYLQRKMSPQEMHAFEKALMNDPFLADALEGYSDADVTLAEKNLAKIEDELTTYKEKAKVVPLKTRQKSWLQIAAVVLVIASAGLLTIALLGKKDEENKASYTSTPAAEIIQNQDTVRPLQNPIAGAQVQPRKQVFNKKNIFGNNNSSNTASPPFVETENEPSVPVAAAPKMMREMSSVDTTLNNQSTANDDLVVVGNGAARKISTNEVISGKVAGVEKVTGQNQFKGRVLNELGKPMSFVTVQSKNKAIGTVSDSKGNFTLMSKDSVLNVEATAPGYVSADTKIRSDSSSNTVVLKEANMSLSEIVVTDLARQKKSTVYEAKREVSPKDAEPEGGWKSFEKYLKRQVDSLHASEDNTLSKEDVVLEFSVDKNGRPVDIKAQGQVNKVVADKLILILSNGPNWKNKNAQKKVKVTVPF